MALALGSSASSLRVGSGTPSRMYRGSTAFWDADAAAYIRAVEAADGQALELGVCNAYHNFFLDLKATSGLFEAIKASCILCGARTLSGALVPLAGTAPTNNNFVAEDYTRGGATPGLKGDASTKYLFASNAHTPLQDSAHQAIYVSAKSTAGAGVFHTHIIEPDDAGTAGDGRTQITQTGTVTFTRCREGGGETRSVIPSVGFVGTSRSDSASYTLLDGGVSVTVSDVSDGISSGEVYLFNSVGAQFSNARLAYWSVGEAVDLAALDSAVSALVAAIGAAV